MLKMLHNVVYFYPLHTAKAYTADELMRSKKKLKSCDAYTKVFVDEDLTPLRSKMLRELKKDSSVMSAWTIDGRIFCKQIVSGKEEIRVIDSPDDLWKVGWGEKKVVDLGFYFSF